MISVPNVYGQTFSLMNVYDLSNSMMNSYDLSINLMNIYDQNFSMENVSENFWNECLICKNISENISPANIYGHNFCNVYDGDISGINVKSRIISLFYPFS